MQCVWTVVVTRILSLYVDLLTVRETGLDWEGIVVEQNEWKRKNMDGTKRWERYVKNKIENDTAWMLNVGNKNLSSFSLYYSHVLPFFVCKAYSVISPFIMYFDKLLRFALHVSMKAVVGKRDLKYTTQNWGKESRQLRFNPYMSCGRTLWIHFIIVYLVQLLCVPNSLERYCNSVESIPFSFSIQNTYHFIIHFKTYNQNTKQQLI